MRHATFVSTYPPQVCGIATFTSHLRSALVQTDRWEADVVAVQSPTFTGEYPGEVVHRIQRDEPHDYGAAADWINSSETDLVSVQHEFGIFGGPEGLYVAELLAQVKKPVVTTLHTVLSDPSLAYHRALRAVARFSDQLVVMTETARSTLASVYDLPRKKAVVAPHGVPEMPFEGADAKKETLGLAGRSVLLTFGLLSPGKGIEFALNALALVVETHPDALYVILGATHPDVRRQSGEAYREHLQDRVDALDLSEHVQFVNRFVEQEVLLEYLQACDVYLTPYPGRQQASSGTLAYAVGAGKAIVSTPYLYAEELLGNGCGRLVPYGETAVLASVLDDLLAHPEERERLRRCAYAVGQSMTWPRVGRRYGSVFEGAAQRGRTINGRSQRPALPPISLAYLRALTDDTGLFQHAPYGVPERQHGYCTDDVGRALLVILRYHQRTADATVVPVVRTYLSFLHHAQTPDGTFRNFLSYDRRFTGDEGSEDTTGRALWGLGAAAGLSPDRALRQIAREMLEHGREVPLRDPRALAYAVCGLAAFLRRHAGAGQSRRRLTVFADALVDHFRAARGPDWTWFHDALTYGNALLPLAMFEAYRETGQGEYRDVGIETLDFLMEATYGEGYFDFVGNEGWYPRDGERTIFAQQSIEAGYTAEACTVAAEVTGEDRFDDYARAAVDWFRGRNRLGVRLYDPASGACSDGLELYGRSFNYGAESTIACLLGLLAVKAPIAQSSSPSTSTGAPLQFPIPSAHESESPHDHL